MVKVTQLLRDSQMLSKLFTVEDGNSGVEKKPAFTQTNAIRFTSQTTLKQLEPINPKKVSDLDKAASALLKKLVTNIYTAIKRLFQCSFDTRTVPQNWREMHVNPIFYAIFLSIVVIHSC